MNLHDNARVLVCVVLYSFILSFTTIMNPILADFPSSNMLLFLGIDWTQRCSNSFDRSQIFKDTAKDLVYKIAKQAPDSRGFAVKRQKLPAGSSVYAMANCWKTMDHNMCSSCLVNAAMVSLSCLPSTDSRVMNAGCFIHYSDYDFTNGPDSDAAVGQFLII